MNKKYSINKEQLYNKYIKEKLPFKEVCLFFGCSQTTFFRLLKKFNIKKNNGGIKVKCNYCPNILLIKPYHYKKNKLHFCDRKCKGKYTSLNLINKNATNFKGGKPKCLDCSKEIAYKAKRCKECQNLYQTFRQDPFCLLCHKQITWGSTYCNHCRMIIYRKNNPDFNKGENHYNWQGGISFEPYSQEFNNKLKEQIRKRDNYICQNCSMTEEEHLIVFGKVLTIHHIDYNKMNSTEDNLIAVCNQCNTRANRNREYWKEYYSKLLLSKVN